MNVLGPNAWFDTSYRLIIGFGGIGTLNIYNGGIADSTADISIAVEKYGSRGYIDIKDSESTLNAYKSMYIGGQGLGRVYVHDNGSLYVFSHVNGRWKSVQDPCGLAKWLVGRGEGRDFRPDNCG